jgi:hypothetical protein
LIGGAFLSPVIYLTGESSATCLQGRRQYEDLGNIARIDIAVI